MQKTAYVTMAFESYVELYEKDIKPRLKENTLLTKESIITQKILPYFKNRKLSDITGKVAIYGCTEKRICHALFTEKQALWGV